MFSSFHCFLNKTNKETDVLCSDLTFFIVVMSNQVRANRGVPAKKLPSVKEPGDPARPEVRGPAGAGEGRRGGTGDGGRGETGSAGSEEGRQRVRSERRGPDIRRPLVVRDSGCQSAGRGEIRRHRSIGDRDRRDWPDDPEPRVGRHTRGDGEGNRSRFLESKVGRRCKPTGTAWWRLELDLDRSHLRSSVGEPMVGEGRTELAPPNDPNSKMMRGSASSGEGMVGISASETVEQLRSSFGDQRPPALSGMQSGYSGREGFFSLSGHFVEKQRSPTHSSQLIRKSVPVSSTEKPMDEDRFVKASELVDKVNRLSRQKSGGLFDMYSLEFSGNCPLCELECHCLGPSCLQRKGISDIFRYKQSLNPKMIFFTGVSGVKVRSALTNDLPRLASKSHCTNPVLPEQKKRCV